MSRTAVAFLVTVGFVAPVAWHFTDADIQHDGKKLRPLQQSFTVDGTRITLDVDRELVMTGDTVTAKVRAYNDTRKQVAIDLLLLHTSNYQGERVEQPWTAIDHEKLMLTAAPDGGPAINTQLVLGKRPDRLAMTDSFKVYVAPRGQKPPVEEGEYSDHQPNYRTDVEAGKAAAVAIEGWSGDSMMISIVPEGPVTANAPFTVAVHVVNTSGDVLPHGAWADLSTEAIYRESAEGTEPPFSIERIDSADQDDLRERTMKPGAKQVTRYRVTPNKPLGKTVTFVASVQAFADEPGPVIAGAKTVASFELGDAKAELAVADTIEASASQERVR